MKSQHFKKLLWTEFLTDFQNIGIKIFRKARKLIKKNKLEALDSVSGLMGHTVLSVPASNMPWGTLKIYQTVALTTLKHRPHRYTDIAGPKGQLVMELR